MSEKSTRRGVIAGALAVLGGAGAAAAASRLDAKDAKPAPNALRLRAPGLVVGAADAAPGVAPSRLSGQALLLDDAGARAGSFTAVAFPSGTSQIELHTFDLDGGTLLGMGSPGAAGFAVVGGTGSYAGARGGYVLERRDDGAADFIIDLSA